MAEHELSWKEAYERWARSQQPSTRAELANNGVAEDLLTTMPWLAFDCGSPRVPISWFRRTERELLLKACTMEQTIRYVADILREVQAVTPNNWHFKEPQP